MKHVRALASLGLVVSLVLAGSQTSYAQQSQLFASEEGRYQPLIGGIEVSVPSEMQFAEAVSRHDIVEILAQDPTFGERSYSQGKSSVKNADFSHEVWALEFRFKPVRLIEVDVPDPSGQLERKLIWYLVYRVRNTGKFATRTQSTDLDAPEIKIESKDKTVRFVPEFTLESWDTQKAYPDRIIPAAVQAIAARENLNRRVLNANEILTGMSNSRLMNSAEISGPIPPAATADDGSLWGVATWEDIDPTTVNFSITIKGLTNAYRWADVPGSYKAGDPIGTGRTVLSKTLKLNFWRPSDAYYEHEGEIRYGYYEHSEIGRFNLSEEDKVDYAWLYQ